MPTPTVTATTEAAPTQTQNTSYRWIQQYATDYDHQLAAKMLFIGDQDQVHMTTALVVGTDNSLAYIGTPEGLNCQFIYGCPLDANRAFLCFPSYHPGAPAVYPRGYYFDWTTHVYTRTTDCPITPTSAKFPVCTRLADGRVLVVIDQNVSYIFDPAGAGGAGSWTATAAGAPGQSAYAAGFSVLMKDGRVLFGSPSSTSGSGGPAVFDPGTGVWTPTTNNPPVDGYFVALTSGDVALFSQNDTRVFYLNKTTLAWDNGQAVAGGVQPGIANSPLTAVEYTPGSFLVFQCDGTEGHVYNYTRGSAAMTDTGVTFAIPFNGNNLGGFNGQGRVVMVNVDDHFAQIEFTVSLPFVRRGVPSNFVANVLWKRRPVGDRE